MKMKFQPTDAALFFTRHDVSDPRLGELAKSYVQLVNESTLDFAQRIASQLQMPHAKNRFVVVGYADDEGIRINGGRAGAAQAPASVRKALYKMTPHLLKPTHEFHIYDIGDLDPRGGSLHERHLAASLVAREVFASGAYFLSIGGGHDYGFSDADAFLQATLPHAEGKPLVINFDAHLDVRPTTAGHTSGTPFFRLLEKYHDQFIFLEVGIQSQCNAKTHLNWALDRGARVIMQDELQFTDSSAAHDSLKNRIKTALGDVLSDSRPTFVSVDIDGFSSAHAPGCSQSWAHGFTPESFFPALQFIIQSFDVRGLGIYEVSPPLDQDDRTSKLAALILHQTISSLE